MSTKAAEGTLQKAFVENLYPILTGLGALYLALLVNHTILQPSLKLAPFAFLGSATALTLFGARWAAGKWALPARWAESATSLVAAVVLAHCVLHLYLLSNFLETTHLGLLGVGITAYFLPTRRLSLVLAVTLSLWVCLAVLAVPSTAWLYFAFGLFAAAGLKVHAECRKAEVDTALERAEAEIAKRSEIESALRLSQERFALAAEATLDGIWDWDLRSESVYYSSRWKSLAGLGETAISSPRDWFNRVHAEDVAALRRSILAHLNGSDDHFQAEYRLRHADGRYRWMLCRGKVARDEKGKPVRFAGSQSDITDRKRGEARLHQLAFYDDLTLLANRRLFLEKIHDAIGRARRRPNYSFAVAVLDLDRFRSVNETWDQTLGDWLLQNTATRLKNRVGADNAARLEADQFGILLEEVQNPIGALDASGAVREEFLTPFQLEDGRRIYLTASMGVAWGRAGKSPQELLRNAEAALRQAKQTGGNRSQMYNPRVGFASLERVRLQDDIQAAFEKNEFRILYQPIREIASGALVSVEALVHWSHPALGPLSSDQFVEAAHEAGVLCQISDWTLAESLRKLAAWRARPPHQSLALSMDLFGRQLHRSGWAANVLETLQAHQIPPDALRMEITEEVFTGGEDAPVLAQMWELQEKGIRFYLDHFGTWRSPLNCLERFPFAGIKLDRSLTRGANFPENRKVVEAVVRLARELSIEVILDGLDSESQLQPLGDLHHECGQGNCFGPAVGASQVEAIVRSTGEPQTLREG